MISPELTPEMHELKEARIEYFVSEKNCRLHGVVHVGANTGQEIPWYIDKLYLPILAFEPHPVAFQELRRIYGRHAATINCALGDKNGVITLRVPENGDHEKSSKYVPIPTEGHQWTHWSQGSSVNVPVLRFDSWVGNNSIDISGFDTLVIDTQGMELEVLKGCGALLSKFNFLCIECSRAPMYEGEAAAQAVIDYLILRGFRQETPIEDHNDILFMRKSFWDL